jgi:predicted lipid-binding transport protein (Tim44 family)
MLMPGLVMLGSRAAGWVRSGRTARRGRAPSRAAAAPGVALPPGVDAARLLDGACEHFRRLQSAWDAGDHHTLRALTTPEMLDELTTERPQTVASPNRTEVLSLQAHLLGFDDLGSAWLASIEFSGTIRETPHRGPMPFRELWLLTRDRSGTNANQAPWRLARHQALL